MIKCLKCNNDNITLLRFNGYTYRKKLNTSLHILNCRACYSNYAINDNFAQALKMARLGIHI